MHIATLSLSIIKLTHQIDQILAPKIMLGFNENSEYTRIFPNIKWAFSTFFHHHARPICQDQSLRLIDMAMLYLMMNDEIE